MKKLIKFLYKIFCKHEWFLEYEVEQYYDYSGFPVHVWRCYCAKCGKVKNKKFWR